MQPPQPPWKGDPQTEVLEDLAEAVNYRRWLSGLALPWLGDDPLEIGSGRGDYAAEWIESVGRFTASEADPPRLTALRRRFSDDPRVTVRELEVPIKEKASHSSVVAYNVLEHIADDVEALRALAGLVRSGGRLVILVPAFPVAMSRFDRSIGHYRRYTRGSLVGALAAADLSPLAVHYLNAPGLLAWIVAMRVLKMQPRAGTLLRLWDRLVPGFASLERRWSPPFGQSLFAVATPRGGGPD
jgi:SAM-dependent methyltransferase